MNAVMFALDTATLIPYVLYLEKNVQKAQIDDLFQHNESIQN